jgi:hypothetical protein
MVKIEKEQRLENRRGIYFFTPQLSRIVMYTLQRIVKSINACTHCTVPNVKKFKILHRKKIFLEFFAEKVAFKSSGCFHIYFRMGLIFDGL